MLEFFVIDKLITVIDIPALREGEGGREGERREGGREGKREGQREGGREGGRERGGRGREGERERMNYKRKVGIKTHTLGTLMSTLPPVPCLPRASDCSVLLSSPSPTETQTLHIIKHAAGHLTDLSSYVHVATI